MESEALACLVVLDATISAMSEVTVESAVLEEFFMQVAARWSVLRLLKHSLSMLMGAVEEGVEGLFRVCKQLVLVSTTASGEHKHGFVFSCSLLIRDTK